MESAEYAASSIEGFHPKQRRKLQRKEGDNVADPTELKGSIRNQSKGEDGGKKGVSFNLEPQRNGKYSSDSSQQPESNASGSLQLPLPGQAADAAQSAQADTPQSSATDCNLRGESSRQSAVLVLDIEDPDSVLDVEVKRISKQKRLPDLKEL